MRVSTKAWGLLFSFFCCCSVADAEYPALGVALEGEVGRLCRTLQGKSAIVSLRDLTGFAWPWHLPAAIETEVVAQLRQAGIDAIDDDTDERFVWLANSNREFGRAEILKWKQEPIFEALVIGDLRRERNALLLRLAAHDSSSNGPLATATLRLEPTDVALDRNTPKMNRDVADFVRGFVGRPIGDGVCATAATEALRSVGAKRMGNYLWGRELGLGEALLPGDILQFEKVRLQAANGSRRASMDHHTAIVNEILGPDAVRVLHQNFGGAGQTISEFTLRLDELRQGTVVSFRPSTGESPLPMRLAPYRRLPAKPVTDAKGHIDLLETIDPPRDSVRGIWQCWEGALTCHKERYAKLQIPVDVPESYVLRATAKRMFGVDCLGFILVVDGRQVLLALDGYGGGIAGLGLINGKKQNDNPTTTRTTLLPLDRTVQIEIRVTADSISLTANGKQVLKWQGDPAQFSMQEEWAAPRQDWLHLTCFEAGFEITSLSLEPGKT